MHFSTKHCPMFPRIKTVWVGLTISIALFIMLGEKPLGGSGYLSPTDFQTGANVYFALILTGAMTCRSFELLSRFRAKMYFCETLTTFYPHIGKKYKHENQPQLKKTFHLRAGGIGRVAPTVISLKWQSTFVTGFGFPSHGGGWRCFWVGAATRNLKKIITLES